MNPRTLILTGLLLPGLLVALPPCALASATWYVDGVSGSDSNNCLSPSTACRTIGHAISLASSGDSILIGSYNYSEKLSIGTSLSLIGSPAAAIDGTYAPAGVLITISAASAHVTLANLTISNGRNGGGAGIRNSGVLTLNNCVMTGNSAEFEGGAIYNSGTLTIIGSTLTSNGVSNTCTAHCPAVGGAIYNLGTLAISNSTLNKNYARLPSCSGRGYCRPSGGAIASNGTLTLSNSTLADNVAFSTCGVPSFCGGIGGGISAGGGGTVAIYNSTIAWNSAQAGGGIAYAATIQNTIVAHNSGGNCSPNPVSNGYNISSDATCGLSGPGDRNNTDPLLGPLQNNGGPTPTMALLSGSPAIDAGNPAGCTDSNGHLLTTDQRGMPRPDTEDKTGCDMGAYEGQTNQP